MGRQHRGFIAALILLLALVSSSFPASADPTGAEITGVATETAANRTPDGRSDARGTITTMLLDAVQQDQHWKAYVGNVTGALTLDDAANFTIYDWDLTTISGQVYASRNSSLAWSSVSCASPGIVVSESAFHNMTDADSDDLNSTFNWTVHRQYSVGSTTIGQDTCSSTVTYVNGTRQVPTTSSPFQELLLQDANGFLIYMTPIEDDAQGFDNQAYDFQMIVAESNVKASPTAYYFYVELR